MPSPSDNQADAPTQPPQRYFVAEKANGDKFYAKASDFIIHGDWVMFTPDGTSQSANAALFRPSSVYEVTKGIWDAINA